MPATGNAKATARHILTAALSRPRRPSRRARPAPLPANALFVALSFEIEPPQLLALLVKAHRRVLVDAEERCEPAERPSLLAQIEHQAALIVRSLSDDEAAPIANVLCDACKDESEPAQLSLLQRLFCLYARCLSDVPHHN